MNVVSFEIRIGISSNSRSKPGSSPIKMKSVAIEAPSNKTSGGQKPSA
jgi:hypothetical protein